MTQATSRTQVAIPDNISKAEWALPTIAFSSGKTFAPTFVFESGYCCRQPSVIVSMSAWACRTEIPGFNRAMHRRKSLSRCSVIGWEPSLVSRKIDTGVQSSAGLGVIGNENRGGITPMT